MIGLEFIANVYNKTYTEIAKEIGVSNQTITDWIKGKTLKIPDKRINDLVTKISEFKGISKELFSKELTPVDKQKITTIYLMVDIEKQLEKLSEKKYSKIEKLSQVQDSIKMIKSLQWIGYTKLDR